MADQSNEMGMVEKVARAIYEADDAWSVAFPWPTMGSKDQSPDNYRRIARAAIEAMHTLSDEAAEAAAIRLREYETGETAESWLDASPVVRGSSRIRAWAAYTAAIDAALSHDEVKG